MKNKRTLAAINAKAISMGLQTNKAKQKTWTKKDYKILEEVSKLSDELKLPIEQVVAIYNLISGKDRSAFSVGERINMIKDPNYKINTERQKPAKDNRPVRCIETGQVFNNKQECADYFGFKRFNLDCYLNPKKHRKECYGKHFEYVDNVL